MKDKKNKNDSDFYINEIKVLDWLINDEKQIIRFKDRIEYKLNNKYHREDGFAIEYLNGIGSQYFIKGEKLEMNEYKNYIRTKNIDKILNK